MKTNRRTAIFINQLFFWYMFAILLVSKVSFAQWDGPAGSNQGNLGGSNLQKLNQISQKQAFRITIFRQYPDSKCTSGYLAVNGTIICYSLEKPWRNNEENISSIPRGKYSGILRYDHNDHWRIELQNVPGRTNVQIHIGNTVDDSKGCILVGDRLNPDLCSLAGGTSALAYKKLKNAFYGTDNPLSTPDKTIIVEIVD